MISPNLHAIWVFFLLNLSQDLKFFLLLYFGTLGDGRAVKNSLGCTLLHKGVQQKIIKTFVIEDFFSYATGV
jgi:hypothetical protein